jgi:enoyl-[acyl-carrier protein] reductase I
MNIPVFPETKVALKGKKGLIVGIANDQSIAWGCAKAFRALGAELAVTYLNDRAKKHVEPLAKVLEAPMFLPLDVNVEGQTEQVFEQIAKEWGQLDFLLHSIAFSPKEALQGEGRRRAARRLPDHHGRVMLELHAHGVSGEAVDEKRRPAVHDGQPAGSEELQHHGRGAGGRRALHGGGVRPERHPRPRRFGRPLATRAASGIPEFDALLDKARAKAPARSLMSIEDLGVATALLAHDAARLMTGETLYVDGGYHIME